MENRITQGQLTQMSDIGDRDKEIIEDTVKDLGMNHEGDADSTLAQAMRAYLTRIFLEMVPDEFLRAGINIRAACFADGWEYATSGLRELQEAKSDE